MDLESFHLTYAGFVLPMVTSLISCTSSTMIIFIIINSGQNTAYHRILFLISFFDIITSLAIGAGTIPMPKDVIYDFKGPTLGSSTTCEITGLTFVLGNGVGISMTSVLNIYYVCVLRFKISEQRFKRRIEPIIVFFAITAPVAATILTLFKKQLINPNPYESYCTIASYPFHCNDPSYPELECIRGVGGAKRARIAVFSILGSSFLVLLATMSTIIGIVSRPYKDSIRTVSKKSHNSTTFSEGSEAVRAVSEKQRNPSMLSEESETPHPSSTNALHALTKEVIIQASLYIGAFLLTWVWLIISYVRLPGRNSYIGDNEVAQVMKAIFQPLQGFYNLMIFLYHKIYNLQKTTQADFLEALKIIFTSPKEVPQERITNLTGVYADMMRRKMMNREKSSLPYVENHDNDRVKFEDQPNEGRQHSIANNIPMIDSDMSYEPSSSASAWTGNSMLSGFRSVFSSVKEESEC